MKPKWAVYEFRRSFISDIPLFDQELIWKKYGVRLDRDN